MTSEMQVVVQGGTPTADGAKVNNFGITFCTINGSGSATANNAILRALFRMGIPVSGKNIFPSNIQGLPTFYTIRVNKDGWLARIEDDDIVVAMNPASFAKDLTYLVPGGVLFYADDIKQPITRDDIVAYPMPIKKLSKESDVANNMRDYIANMVYVGVVAQMLDIPLEMIYQALDYHFKGKAKAIDSNFVVVKAAAAWAAANLVKRDPYRVEAMAKTEGHIMSDGNTAGALGAIFGGVQFTAWYPITPASSLAEAVNEYLPSLRKDPVTGKYTCVVMQAEDELAAIGMTVGAGWGGLRAMTSTSGPGLSLMTEYTGLAYAAEIPIVVWDVQRVGPSTGLPTRTAQGDLTMVNFMSHGDTQYVILLPGTVTECFEFGWRAFDIAERLQMPVFVLSDQDLGMNQWMTSPFTYPDQPMDRGKILWEEDLEKIKDWARYRDVDGDGVPYRTVLGNQHPRAAYFTRGTGHDERAGYSEDPDNWEQNVNRMRLKYETAKTLVPRPILETMEGAEIGIITMGSAEQAVAEARYDMALEGIKTNCLRVRALPFTQEVVDFVNMHTHNYVVEVNRDGQLKQLLTLELPERCARLVSIAHVDGLPLSARWVKNQIMAYEEK
jgi:2-oxoglutarate/2-oxoacid ferredoxin oxidoreductase subunit alpha